MNSFSHIVIATKLEPLVQPKDPPDYYWGAVAPDIRYLAAMRRWQTHRPTQEIVGWLDRYPHLGSFVQGYLVHCLTDHIDLARIFYRRLPFSVLKGWLTHHHLAVLLEFYYLETQATGQQLSGTHNEVLSELGVSPSLTARFARSIQPYVRSASLSDLSGLVGLLGLENDSRVERYAAAARQFQQSRVLKNILFLGIRAGKIGEQIVSRVTALYRRAGVTANGRGR